MTAPDDPQPGPTRADRDRAGHADVGNVGGIGNSTVAGARGPVNAGSGQQFVGTIAIGHDAIAAALRRPSSRRLVSNDVLDWLTRRFVAPAGYDAAAAALATPGLVVVAGAAGSGRRTAARMLLRDSGHRDGGSQQELSVEESNGNTRVIPSPDTVLDEDRLLLDLSDLDPVELPAVERALDPFRAEVERRTYVVVVLPEGYEPHISTELRSLVRQVRRPDHRAVLRSHLESAQIVPGPEDLSHPLLDEHLATSPMSELAEIARVVADARTGDRGTGTLQQWLITAVGAFADRGDEAARNVRAVEDGRKRSLLFAAGMLEGAPADVIFHAQQRLLTVLEYPSSGQHALDDQDFAQQLASLGVVFGPRRRTAFTQVGYDAALRRHFWTHFPGLRDHFRDWTAWVAVSGLLGGSDLEVLIERFTDQLLEVERPVELLALVESWCGQAHTSTPGFLRPLEQALRRGLGHPLHGNLFRRTFWEWSRRPNGPAALANLVIELSAATIAATHPDQAVVRLHHLTRHNDADVRESALEALIALSQDRLLWRRILTRLCGNPLFPAMRAADRPLFLALVTAARAPGRRQYPIPFTTGVPTQIRSYLVKGWHTVLSDPTGAPPREFVEEWLDADTASGEPHLTPILVDACAADPALLGRLFAVSRNWVRSTHDTGLRPLRERTAADLRDRIDRAQGLSLTVPPDLEGIVT